MVLVKRSAVIVLPGGYPGVDVVIELADAAVDAAGGPGPAPRTDQMSRTVCRLG
jgi:hypothetical protein